MLSVTVQRDITQSMARLMVREGGLSRPMLARLHECAENRARCLPEMRLFARELNASRHMWRPPAHGPATWLGGQ